MGDALTRVYRKGVLEAEGFAVADVSEHLERPDTVVWVDFCAPSKSQLTNSQVSSVCTSSRLKTPSGPHQRPKVDHYATHLFLSCQAVRVNAEEGGLEETEIDSFIEQRWLITVRKDEGFSIEGVLGRWDRSPEPRSLRDGVLALWPARCRHRQLLRRVQAFDDYYDEVSDGIF